MSKERLEEIINNLPYSIRHEGNTEKLIEYAKEQTERVEDNDQAIVDLNKHVEELEDENVDLEQQNKRYREELDILGEVINSAPNADKLNEEYERLKGLEGEE